MYGDGGEIPGTFVAVPIFVIPIVVTAIVVRSDRERGANYCPEGQDG